LGNAGLVLAIDPGVRGCGAALFEHRMLVKASYVANVAFKGEARAVEAAEMAEQVKRHFPLSLHAAVIEWPQVYAGAIRAGKSKADPNDLLALTAVAGAIATKYIGTEIFTVRPAEWKGQVPKSIVANRVWDCLEGVEVDVLKVASRDAGRLAHNIVDAVGIGLCYIGRWGIKWRSK